jgi:hypothetical protein
MSGRPDFFNFCNFQLSRTVLNQITNQKKAAAIYKVENAQGNRGIQATPYQTTPADNGVAHDQNYENVSPNLEGKDS